MIKYLFTIIEDMVWIIKQLIQKKVFNMKIEIGK